MKKSTTFTYEVENGLYINLTNRCSNRCEFCIRNNGDGAYGSDSLWLEYEPSASEVLEDIERRDMSKYSEVVFCGYGEPTYRLEVMISVARELKRRYGIKTRVNTNGHSDLINGSDTAALFEGALDTVCVSLNTPNPEKYEEICHPVYKKAAYDAMLEFAKNVKKYVQNVSFSVVGEFLSEKEIEECRKIAEDCGVALRVRDYISS